jgi:putative ABC transport system permease protein
VLLLACTNVTNLLVARASARSRELAVRTALGATSWRIARQLMAETFVLTGVAGAAGLLLGFALVGIVRHAADGRLPFATELRVDEPAAFFAAAVTLVTAMLVGLVPALRAGGGPIVERMRSGAAAAVGGAGERRLRSALVSVQFAFAVTLLIAAGLLLQSFRRLESVPLGYDAENLISFTISAPSPKYDQPTQAAALYAEILNATRSLPTVAFSAAAGGALLPTNVEMDGLPVDRPPPQALYHPASTDYVRALRVPMIEGRWFTDDDMRSPAGFVINERLAKMLVPGASAIGRRITVHRSSQARADFGQPITMPVIGVVADIHEYGRANKPDPEVFLPYTLEVWPWMNFVLRAPNAARVIPGVVQAMRKVDPAIRFRDKPSVEEHSFAGVVAPPFMTLVLSGFAACALVLAAVGLYGIVAYGVIQRRREIGIRIALGASTRHVVTLVMREGAVFVLGGTVLGLAGALAATRLLTTMLFDTKATDAETFAGVLILLVVVAVAAGYLPARRAAKVDPMIAIRMD